MEGWGKIYSKVGKEWVRSDKMEILNIDNFFKERFVVKGERVRVGGVFGVLMERVFLMVREI